MADAAPEDKKVRDWLTDNQVEHINLKVVGPDGGEVCKFLVAHRKPSRSRRARIFKNSWMRMLPRLDRYVIESLIQKRNTDVRFLYEGERLNAQDTPLSLDMEDGDQIQALIEQQGGCF